MFESCFQKGTCGLCVVLCVYNYHGFSFVRTGNHDISLPNFLFYLFKHIKLSLVYGIVEVNVV